MFATFPGNNIILLSLPSQQGPIPSFQVNSKISNAMICPVRDA